MDREKLLNNLKKHGFHALWFETKEDAADYLRAAAAALSPSPVRALRRWVSRPA